MAGEGEGDAVAERAAKTGVRALTPLFQLDENGRLPGEVAIARIAPWVSIGALMIICAIFGYGGWLLWSIWQQGTSDWSGFWDAINFNGFYFLVLLMQIGSYSPPGVSMRSDFLALRRAAAAGDEQLAPLAKQQPAPYAGYEQPIGRTKLAPVLYLNQRAIVQAQRAGLVLGLIFGPMFLALTALLIWAFASFGPPPAGNDLTDLLVTYALTGLIGLLGLMGPFFFVWVFVAWRRIIALKRGLVVTVDESGLRWKRLPWQRKTRLLPWESARSFFSLAYRREKDGSQRVIYVLDGGTALLTWEALVEGNRYETPTGELTTRQQREREANDRLACVIAQRTRLPLRDVTALAEEIIGANGATGELMGRARMEALFAGDAETYQLLDEAKIQPPTNAKEQRQREKRQQSLDRLAERVASRAEQRGIDRKGRTAIQRRWDYNARQDVRFARLLAPFYGPQGRGADLPGLAEPKPLNKHVGAGCLVALVVVLVWALLAGASWGMQRYQTNDYSSLPARVQAEAPIYASPLASNDGLWLEQQPTKAYACSYGFAHGAYQISGTADGDFGDAWPIDGVGNSAVAVTVSESGALKNGDNDGIGLLLDGNEAGTEFITFSVYRDGSWDISHYRYTGVSNNSNDYWTTVDSGSSDVIHTADGAANRLLVVSRGPLRLFYVNGQLMTAYNDTNDHLPHVGAAGVYLNNCSMTGRFTNFANYPAPPQPPLFSLSSWLYTPPAVAL